MLPLIAVWDEDDSFRRLCIHIATASGFRAVGYSDRVALFADLEADCVIAEMVTATGSAGETIRRIAARGVPVIAVSGSPLELEALGSGAVVFLEKPFKVATLVALLKRFAVVADEPIVRYGSIGPNETNPDPE